MLRARLPLLVAGCLLTTLVRPINAQTTPTTSRVLEFRYTPTARAQVALWIEKADGTFVQTIGLTQAVGYRGIGNRPGAAHMNSGFHWPYGRREGTLPIWAHRRAAAPGATQWSRIIFQNRASEGDASRTSEDSTTEKFFCLSFNSDTTQKDQLDAVSCASGFNSDKGRYIKSADVAAGYSEPVDDSNSRPLDLVSLYPPRRDVTRCPSGGDCADTADTASYANDARTAMPEIDSVTMATAPGGDMEQSILFAVPSAWPDGDYIAWAEVNTEGDSNANYTFSTPEGPSWDSWAETYGYSYRGQPSVAFSVPFSISTAGVALATKPTGYGDVDGYGPAGGALHPIDSSITDDPNGAPGSGADRLRMITGSGYRLKVSVRVSSPTGPGTGGVSGSGGAGGGAGTTGSGGMVGGSGAGTGGGNCTTSPAPAVPASLQADHVDDPKNSYQWGKLHFLVPTSSNPIHNYEVRVGQTPITTADDPTTVLANTVPAVSASLEMDALVVPTTGAANSAVDVNFGGLSPLTTYYVAVRAVDDCAVAGAYAVAKFTTTKISFTKLSGCFVATAAYGSAMEPEVQSLRVARDALRARSTTFATFSDLYYRAGPVAADVVGRSDVARAVVRRLLAPIVAVTKASLAAREP